MNGAVGCKVAAGGGTVVLVGLGGCSTQMLMYKGLNGDSVCEYWIKKS